MTPGDGRDQSDRVIPYDILLLEQQGSVLPDGERRKRALPEAVTEAFRQVKDAYKFQEDCLMPEVRVCLLFWGVFLVWWCCCCCFWMSFNDTQKW